MAGYASSRVLRRKMPLRSLHPSSIHASPGLGSTYCHRLLSSRPVTAIPGIASASAIISSPVAPFLHVGLYILPMFLARSANLPTGLYVLPSVISSQYLLGRFSQSLHHVVGIEMQMINPTFFFRYLKGRCHDNQFCGKVT